MFPIEHYFVIVNRTAVCELPLTYKQVGARLATLATISIQCSDWEDGSPTTLEDDGEYIWTVQKTSKLAPDGIKRIAYVVAGCLKNTPTKRADRFA